MYPITTPETSKKRLIIVQPVNILSQVPLSWVKHTFVFGVKNGLMLLANVSIVGRAWLDLTHQAQGFRGVSCVELRLVNTFIIRIESNL